MGKKVQKMTAAWILSIIVFAALPACSAPESWETNSGLRGSADVCRGNAVVCTIFVNNPADHWDFSRPQDSQRGDKIRDYLGVACGYLEDEASRYGQKLRFIWDFEAESDLVYTYHTQRRYETEGWDEALWRFIDREIDVKGIADKYQARNVLFLACMNTDETCEAVSSTRNWYEGMPYPYEFISLYYVDSGEVICPAVYAHEILHTFGAPDLYMEDAEYGLTADFVSWTRENIPNDIMYTCSELETGEYVYDRITNEISEVTAYYIGWLPDSEVVSGMGLYESQYAGKAG